MTQLPWLSSLIFFPLVGAVVLALLPARAERAHRLWATLIALAEVAFALPLWWRVEPGPPGWQFAEKRDWLPMFGASYSIGVDGISSMLVLLTVVLTALAVIGAWSAVEKPAMKMRS